MNANRAAPSRPSPTNRPRLIVMPDRDRPGCRARAWPAPITRASRRVACSNVRRPSAPSAQASTNAPTMSITATSQIWSVVRSIGPANTTPATAAGTDETRTSRARRASFDSRSARQGAAQAHEVVAEVGDGAEQGPQVEGDVERLLQRLVAREVVPPEQPRHQDEVARRRDREVLGEPLGDAQDDGVDDRHGPQSVNERTGGAAVRAPGRRPSHGARRAKAGRLVPVRPPGGRDPARSVPIRHAERNSGTKRFRSGGIRCRYDSQRRQNRRPTRPDVRRR